MKTLRKNHLPEAILYKDVLYYRLMPVSELEGSIEAFIKEKKACGQKVILCEVLASNLNGRLNLHGKPYQPTKWIFIYPLI